MTPAGKCEEDESREKDSGKSICYEHELAHHIGRKDIRMSLSRQMALHNVKATGSLWHPFE
jgi:hypothetical protein